MKVLVLWVPPAERRFGSGDVMTSAQLAEFGIDVAEMIAAREAQVIDPLDHDGNGRKGGSRRKAKEA